MNKKINSYLEFIKKCKVESGIFCTNYCRDCRYMEMDNNAWNDGTRRCAYKGEWLRPSTPACPRFEP